jgi:hypothetical protein
MQIRFVSGLTAGEENQFAPALLQAITTILDQFPLAYTLRIETSGNQVFQHSQPGRSEAPPVVGHADLHAYRASIRPVKRAGE